MKSWKSALALLLVLSAPAAADENDARFWVTGQADGNLDRSESTSYAFESQYFG
jgi:hypothetical protein